WLRAGGSLYTSPEGRLSPDGRISRVTAQIHRVLHDSPSTTPVVPIMLTYDFMRPGRMRAYVRVALPIARAPMLAPAKLDALLRAGWIAEATFTCTQIASAWLIERGPEPFTTGELAAAIYADARRLQSSGHHVTAELLRPAGALQAARSYLGWSARHRVVGRAGRNRWRALPQPTMHVPIGDVGYRRWPLAYANNEYHEWREGTADTRA
ncbi:MAG TPA: hypothetical protein VF807_09130, partial [Ktedonobacterales bacterium]